ncbi:uncharacterized protein [Panulirus ornatus]|uniref:uncharacterized protein n=1 Tax=Panulirus ornatus TaxID=150431 RepID=UPI003A884781
MKKPGRKTDPSPERLSTLIPQSERSKGPQEHFKLSDAVLHFEGTNEEPDWAAVGHQTKVKRTRCGTSQRMSDFSQHSMNRIESSPGIIVPDTVCTHPENKEDSTGIGCLAVMKTLWAILVRVARTTKSDARILRSRRALVLALVNTFTKNSMLNFVMLAPFAMNTKGYTLEVSAWCISVMGIPNLTTRLILSPLADWKRFDIRLSSLSGSAVMGSAVLLFFATNIVWITMAFVAYGCGLGAALTFVTLTTIKYMGMENFAATYGAASLAAGCSFPFVGAIIGFICDISGGYMGSLWVVAALSYMSFTLWLFMPAAVAYDK